MSVFRIESVSINPKETWQDITDFNSWQTLKSSSQSWEHINQIVEVNQSVTINIVVIISSWERVKEGFGTWRDVSNTVSTWLTLQTW